MLDNELYKQFLEISTRIDDEETSFQNEITPKESDDYEDLLENHLLRQLSLLCIRISFCCKLVGSEYSVEADKQLKNDIDYIEKIIHDVIYHISSDVTTKQDIFDLLRIVCPEDERVFLDYFRDEQTLSEKSNSEIPNYVYWLVMGIANYYITDYSLSYGISLLENLCNISQKRNSLDMHQYIVKTVLQWLYKIVPKTAVHIAENNSAYFRKSNNDYAADYFMFYGHAKSMVGDYYSAQKFYEKCYEIRKSLYGEDDWRSACAKRDAITLSYSSTHSEKDRKFLISFVDNIESDNYELSPELIDTAKLLEGGSLYLLLCNSNPIDNPNEYWRLLSLFERIAYKYDSSNNSRVKVRVYKALLGEYYYKIGDYIQAEIAYTDALNAKIDPKISEMVTETQLKLKLMLIYYEQNDLKMVNTLLPQLLDSIGGVPVHFNDMGSKKLSFRNTCYVLEFVLALYGESLIGLSEGVIGLFRKIAAGVYRDIMSSNPAIKNCICEAVYYLCIYTTNLSARKNITEDELKTCMNVMEMVRKKALPAMRPPDRITLTYTLFALSWKFDGKNTDYYFSKVVKLLEDDNVFASKRGEILLAVGTYYYRAGNHGTGIRYVTQALREIESKWRSYTRYLNDDRLLQILIPTQELFENCYSMLRQFVDVESAYESILRFKSLASLAGRERNRLLHQADVDADLMKEIRKLQNRLSALENAGTFSDTEVATTEVRTKLRKLEAEFAEQFPNQNQFTEITWEKVNKAIPNNCIVIEFFYCPLSYGQTPFDLMDETVDTGIDVYITQKQNNKCTLSKITIDDGDSVIADATEFVSIIQEKSATPKQKLKLEKLRKCLYDRLVQPIMPYVEGFKTVYIAPDSSLVNLSFEILYGDKQERLGDAHSVIRIECARDFLYSDDATDATKGELIIGNPKYNVRSREIKEETRDSSKYEDTRFPDMTYTKQLPFASVEVRRISERSGYPNYTGIFAKKDLILSASGYKSIHIATHGMFDLSQSTNSMYSSYLLFAGVDNWFNTGRLDGLYGDGIVTADEISRLDLNSTELVVLSSCLSGMNDVKICKSFNGMVSAFSAAGVHYVISHLWEAADFSTAVLMDEFYHQYLDNKKSPPEALSVAKEYLRNVTIGDLRRNHWFDDIRKEELDSETEETISKYEGMDGRMKPFKNEAYWGGFSCYQCY